MPELPPALLSREGLPPLWREEELFFEGDAYYDAVLRDLAGAHKHVTVEVYIFEDDAFGRRFFAALEDCAARGVRVQILLDGLGSHRFIQRLQTIKFHPNIRVKVYNPHPWTFSYRRWHELGLFWGSFLRRLWWINRRDHRKIITIDGEVAYVGSFNITGDHLRSQNPEAWRDIGLRLVGDVAPLLVLAMLRVWSLRAYLKRKKALLGHLRTRFTHPDLRLNHSFALRRSSYKDFLARFNGAERRIWIKPGYFLPRRRLVRLMARAAKRGVDVRVLLSRKSDVFYYTVMQTYHLPRLIAAGVKIYRYDPVIVHSKSYIIDDTVSVGSTNLNHRSFMHDLEVDVFVQHPDNRRALDANFEAMQDDATAITQEWLRRRSWWEKIAAEMVFLFRHWN
jgi:cardiolipin synthase